MKICRQDHTFKKSVFLFAAIAAKNLDQLENSKNLCTRGITLYANYTDLIIYRAKIH